MSAAALYDDIGRSYRTTRVPDPRIAAAIDDALGDARTVVNVGAGAGSYEPRDRELTAVEPSAVMIAQRPAGAAPVVRGVAEALPFDDDSFDASMAVLSDHHWSDRPGGLRELRRVARRRAVLLTFDPAVSSACWLTRDYLPDFEQVVSMTLHEIAGHLGADEVRTVPIPRDCADGFLHAYWARPHAYFDPVVRDNISVFSLLGPAVVDPFLARLHEDLDSGAWEERYGAETSGAELDCGYRLLIARLGA